MAVQRCGSQWRTNQCGLLAGHVGFHRNGMSVWDGVDLPALSNKIEAAEACGGIVSLRIDDAKAILESLKARR